MKVSLRACRHCRSPAKGNPCWWDIKPRNWSGDPPCVVFIDEPPEFLTGPRIAIVAYSAVAVITAALIFFYT